MRPSRFLMMMSASLAMLLVLCNSAGAQTLTVIHNFGATGPQYPLQGPMAQSRDGSLYGTSYYPGLGSVYRIGTNGHASDVYAFDGSTASTPIVGVTMASDGRFYGGTNLGGSADYGVLYRVTSGGSFDSLHDFAGGSDGSRPIYPPIETAEGNFYGATYGDLFPSTVYKYVPSGTFATVYTFPEPQANYAGLLQASNGHLYGVTQTGGAKGAGTLFEITTSGTLVSLYNFTCHDDGGYPVGTLVQGPDGTFYGTTGICGLRKGRHDFQVRSATATDNPLQLSICRGEPTGSLWIGSRY